nr:putative transmembrane protein (PGPGW) [uncultured bacterium]
MPSKVKRIATDTAGYGLILLGIATGWLPGPGGIPLVLGGLGLLSINNAWARRLRVWIMDQGGSYVQKLFPKHPVAQAFYDLAVVFIFAVVAWLAWKHAAIWQISLATALFFIALLIAGINRDRYASLKARLSHKNTN